MSSTFVRSRSYKTQYLYSKRNICTRPHERYPSASGWAMLIVSLCATIRTIQLEFLEDIAVDMVYSLRPRVQYFVFERDGEERDTNCRAKLDAQLIPQASRDLSVCSLDSQGTREPWQPTAVRVLDAEVHHSQPSSTHNTSTSYK